MPYNDRESILIKAWDRKLGRLVAIKTLRLDFDTFNNVPERNQERLLQEAQILSKLKHPSLVEIYSVLSTPFAIIQEWVHDTSLQDILDRKQPLDLG